MITPSFELRQRNANNKNWSVRFKFHGKEYSKTFKGVTVKRVAEKEAEKFFIEEVLPNFQTEQVEAGNPLLSDFLKVYLDDSKTALMKVSPATKKRTSGSSR